MALERFQNPFRPGAGHSPPYLAGRSTETEVFKQLLGQEIILQNLVLTGLRGVGKTVLLDTFKPLALSEGWLWVGTDLSETSSINEENMVVRLLTDLSVVSSGIKLSERKIRGVGFSADAKTVQVNLQYATLLQIYQATPGLPADKLKRVLEVTWECMKGGPERGIVFAYDEAQNLSDHAADRQYPTSMLLDVFQSLQKKGIPFMLVLVGLPTLFPQLVEARTFAERMFRVVFLDRLSSLHSRQAIEVPIQAANCPVRFTEPGVNQIVEFSGGYPYFIQFICREAYDAFLQGQNSVPLDSIAKKLDSDFFAGRWARATDRQRELLTSAALLENSDSEFSVQEIVEKSKEVLDNPFTASNVNQMLVALTKAGLTYKNRHGKYSFAVPLLDRFILRQSGRETEPII